MLNSLRAERIKMRHLKLPVLAAGVGMCFSGIIWLILRGALIRSSHETHVEEPWQNGVIGDSTIFAVLAFPTLVILLTALSFYPEHRNDMWKQLRCVPTSINSVYVVKFFFVQALIVLALVTAAASALIGWTLIPIDVRNVLNTSNGEVAGIVISLASQLYICLIPVAAIQFALSARFSNVLYPVAVGVAFTVISLLLSGPSSRLWFPYAYPAGVVISEFGVTPRPVLEDQKTDVEFKLPAGVFGPASGQNKVILVDEAHANRHGIGTAEIPGTLRWIVAPAEASGIDVRANRSVISSQSLSGVSLLVIAGVPATSTGGTVTADEVKSIATWIREGGSLLLLTDHAPYAQALEGLAQELGVRFSLETVSDPAFADPRAPESARLVFNSANGLLAATELTDGVRQVVTYGGQAVSRAATGTISVLSLAPTVMTETGRKLTPVVGGGRLAQMIAFTFGKGRVVVSGETAVLTAQRKEDGSPIGVGDHWTDNAKLAANVVRWLLRQPSGE
jgi:hypothetical protein